MLFMGNELRVNEISACNMLDAVERDTDWYVFWRLMSSVTHRSDVSQKFDIPILRNHTDLGLLVSRPQFHANPISARCPATLASNSATCAANCGSGVS